MIELAKKEDLDEIVDIIMEARNFLKNNKVPQWQGPYPNRDSIIDDINNNYGYVYKEDNKILGYFAQKEYEPNYDRIEDGKWLDDSTYIVIHRMAVSSKGKGVGSKIFKLLQEKYHHIRIDTHELNIPMNKALLKNDFKYCGIIYVEDKTKRNAYEYIGKAYEYVGGNMELNKYIDHTILKADAKKEDVLKVCMEAKEYDFASVCVNTCWVPLVHKELEGTTVKTCCVVGFPLGAMATKAKALETKVAVEDGADEVDMVINVGAAKDHDYDYVEEDIKAVVAEANGKTVKVIIETCLLTDEEKVEVCKRAVNAKANFVKTSTGFSTGGAKVEDVKLMYDTVNGKALVKASGGIKTLADAEAMIKAGASRLGCSAGKKIIDEYRGK